MNNQAGKEVICVPSNPDNRPNKKDAPHWIEQRPRTVSPETVRKLGETAIKNTPKDKKGK